MGDAQNHGFQDVSTLKWSNDLDDLGGTHMTWQTSI